MSVQYDQAKEINALKKAVFDLQRCQSAPVKTVGHVVRHGLWCILRGFFWTWVVLLLLWHAITYGAPWPFNLI